MVESKMSNTTVSKFNVENLDGKEFFWLVSKKSEGCSKAKNDER